MDMNLRKDHFFVQDDAWYEAEERFSDYLSEALDKKLVLLNQAVVPESFGSRAVGIDADMAKSIKDIAEEVKRK